MKTVKIGLLGLGNIGTGTVKALEMNRTQITKAAGAGLEIVKILDRHPERKRDIDVKPEQFVSDIDDIVNDPEIDVVIELLGGVEPAATFMRKALEKGKHVVSANKAAIAANFDTLAAAAEKGGAMFLYEASVAGGIPVLNAIRCALGANEFGEVLGILNGTTNYILTQMTEKGETYADALKDAQVKGFAEPDPTADVEGHDVANKLTILMALAFDKYVKPEDIPTTGISGVTAEDIAAAKAEGCCIKLIASAKKTADGVEYGISPQRIPLSHPLAGVKNEFNAVYVTGNAVGELMFYGKGAGPLPTASAVLGDVIQIANHIG